MPDYRLIPASADPQTRLALRMADLESRLATVEGRSKGSIITTYSMYGANSNWILLAGAGQGVYVDAAQTNQLRWDYTPPFDVWAEVHTQMLVWNSGTASWLYSNITLGCSPAPGSGPPSTVSRVYDHNGASGGGVTNHAKAVFPLTGGVAYSMACSTNNTGGNTFQYYQGSQYLFLLGKAWPR